MSVHQIKCLRPIVDRVKPVRDVFWPVFIDHAFVIQLGHACHAFPEHSTESQSPTPLTNHISAVESGVMRSRCFMLLKSLLQVTCYERSRASYVEGVQCAERVRGLDLLSIS